MLNAQEKDLNRNLKELEIDKKREHNIVEDIKSFFRLKKRNRWQHNKKYEKSLWIEKTKLSNQRQNS